MSTPRDIACAICGMPINLEVDRFADEDGKTVHEHCYIQKLVTSQGNDPPDPHHAE